MRVVCFDACYGSAGSALPLLPSLFPNALCRAAYPTYSGGYHYGKHKYKGMKYKHKRFKGMKGFKWK